MPNGLTFMALRPLILPLALVSLGLGFVLWRFMGDIPSVLGMGLDVLVDGLRHGGRSAARGVGLPIAYPVDAGIDAIRAVDPAFSTPSFLAEVQRIGNMLLAGWAKRNLADCRSLMTEAGWDLQAAQLARPVADGWRPFATGVTLNPESIVAVRSDAATDRITVRTRMECPAGTGKVIRGRRIGEWIEDWTLVRSRVRSPASAAGRGLSSGWLVDGMNHVAVHLERAA
ncbi:MAG TPA: TIM44-like domain-containing protein [Candidatus Dormibacteraeota bacterium]|nr:TIM44-like domain-containing protein [Candidatus Dormibacteraeota bacterium]